MYMEKSKGTKKNNITKIHFYIAKHYVINFEEKIS